MPSFERRGGSVTSSRWAGRAMPSLRLPTTLGGDVALDRIPSGGARLGVVFIYPWSGRPGVDNPPGWDDIPGAHGSTPEAAGFAMRARDFMDAGVEIFGLSGQTVAWQEEFSQRLALPFALISDVRLQLAAALDLPSFETGGVRYLERLTLVMQAGQIVCAVHPIEDPAGHAEALLSLVRGMD